MADVSANSLRGSDKSSRKPVRIDLTPMVDLGFLLITFFLFTTTMAQPRVMQLNMPYKGEAKPDEWKAGQTMTILLSKSHRIYYYEGIGNDSLHPPVIRSSSFAHNAIRQAIMNQIKQVRALQASGKLNARNEAAFLLKAMPQSTYQDLVTMLDELNICGVRIKAVVDVSPAEAEYVRQQEMAF